MTLVLLVDDSPVLRNQLRSILEKVLGFERFLEAENGLEAFKLLVEHRPDIVLCDLVMPNFDGLKFLALRATRSELSHIPVIMLTSETDTDRKVEVLDRGASDYVTKPFNERELIARVRVHYRVKVLQDELVQANTRLSSLAVTDGLTGLFNRRYLDTVLLNELKQALRYSTPLSVILVDLDRFKQVNDTYGHLMGDEVLRNVSHLLATSVRGTDTVARYGGEELAIVLPRTEVTSAAEMAERLRRQLAETSHSHGGVTIQCSASFGVAALNPADEPIGPEELLRRADEALFKAKQDGRNRVLVA